MYACHTIHTHCTTSNFFYKGTEKSADVQLCKQHANRIKRHQICSAWPQGCRIASFSFLQSDLTQSTQMLFQLNIHHQAWSNRLERWQTAVAHCVRQAFLLMRFLEGKWIVAICHQMHQLSAKNNKCNDVVRPFKIRPTQTRSDLSLQPSEDAFNMNESSYTSVHVLSPWCIFSTWCLTLILFDTCSLLVVVAAESCCNHGVKI